MAENLLQPVSKDLPPEGRAQPGRTARQAALRTQRGSLGDSGRRQGQAVAPGRGCRALVGSVLLGRGFYPLHSFCGGFPGGNEPACPCRRHRRCRSDP